MASLRDRQELNVAERDIEAGLATQVSRASSSLFWIRLLLILGGALAATVAGLLPSAADAEVPWKQVIGIGGACSTFVGGALLIYNERGSEDYLRQALEAVRMARKFVADRDQYLRIIEQARELDARRRELAAAQKAMLEAAEQGFWRHNHDLEDMLRDLFDSAERPLFAAMGFLRGENYNLSVFRREDLNGRSHMVRVFNRCADKIDEKQETRSWLIGEGYTGAAWQRGGEVLLADTNADDVRSAFYVPDDKFKDSDNNKYVSVASLPLRVGPDGEIKGVLTISSDRVGRFTFSSRSGDYLSVEVARTLAKVLEILASYEAIDDTGLYRRESCNENIKT